MRTFQDRDIETFSAYRSDPNVAKYQSWETPYSTEKAADFVAYMQEAQPHAPGGWYQIAIELKGNAQLIGDCAIHTLADDPRQAEIGFTLASAHQGNGYATEAVTRLLNYLFNDVQLHRVTAYCDVENEASAKLLERLGMRREAHTIENIWFKGRWASEYMYAILQREWCGET